MAEIRFVLDGRPHVVSDASPHTTLLHHLRGAGKTGTKEGCAEGECGACAVAFVSRGPDGKTRYEAVNSCLVLLPSVHGREVVTSEGVAGPQGLHPVQREMAEGGGSQCGYCTPGFVVSLFAEYYRNTGGPLDEESIAGNLCRCTGYRPIREATHRLAQIRAKDAGPDPHRDRLASPPSALGALDHEAGGVRFLRPTTLRDACAARAAYPSLVLVTGGTDVVVDVNQRHSRPAGYLSLEAVPELRGIERKDGALVIGAAVPLAELEERLHAPDAASALGPFWMLRELLPLFSSRLIRTRATLGGNLGTASPIGDSPPVLLALGAEVVAASVDPSGVLVRRAIPLDRFFLGYRKTELAPHEILVEVRLPLGAPRLQRFYKVSKRKMDDISTVAGAFALDTDESGTITLARFAYGGVAATPVRLPRAEVHVVGKRLSRETLHAAATIAEAEVTPMDDHRGSARYRRAMVGRLLHKLAADLGLDAQAGAAAP